MSFLIKRSIQMLLILVLLSAALFGLLAAMPGNPVDLLITSNPNVKPEDIMRLKKLRGLDRPWYVQYYRWLFGYPEPARPPQIAALSALTIGDANAHEKLSFDLASSLFDPNYQPKKEELLRLLHEVWPDWQKGQNAAQFNQAVENGDLAAVHVLLGQHNPAFERAIQEKIEIESRKNLKIRGLFGALVEGTLITQTINKDNVTDIFFIVENSYGQEKLGRIPVLIKDGSTSLKRSDLITPIQSQLLPKEDEPFKLDLNKFKLVKDSKLSFTGILGNETCVTSEGQFERSFAQAGQSVLAFTVSDENGKSQNMAFELERGVIPHDSKFNPGFLYFFTGNRNALGFSQTYKRPVYDILFGNPTFCGDSRTDPGEACDDGNLENGDGCDSRCFIEGSSVLQKADVILSGFLLRSGRIGNTVQLMLPALLLSLLLAIPLGIFSAYRQYSWLDYCVNFLAFVGISLPVFWFGIMMIYVFAENWQIFPAGGVQTPGIYGQGSISILLDRLHYAVLPTLVLSIFYIGRWLRYMRASMLEVLPKDYIRTARAKGLSESKVIIKHAFRNALIPVVTVLAISIPSLFGGAVLTETVFSWPGVGRLQYEAVMSSDYYLAIVVFLVAAVLVMVGNLLADILYVLVDPRMRKQR